MDPINGYLKAVLAVLVGALFALLLVAAFSSGGMMGGVGSKMGRGVVGRLFMLLFWGLVVALLVTLVVAIPEEESALRPRAVQI